MPAAEEFSASPEGFHQRAAPSAFRLLPPAILLQAGLFLTGLRFQGHPRAFSYLLGFIIAFSAYLIAVFLILRRGHCLQSRNVLYLVLALAAAFRVTAVLHNVPWPSSDLWRYRWEGKIITLGFNPYQHAPKDPLLAPYRDEAWKHMNHKDISTIYPPVSQYVFAAAYGIGLRSHQAWRGLFSFFDFATCLLLLWLLPQVGRPASYAIIYAWNPLVILEFGAGGHQDSLGIFLLMVTLALSFASSKYVRRFGSPVALAVTTLAKGYALIFLPLLVRAEGLGAIPLFAAAAVLLTILFAKAGSQLFAGFRAYSEWNINGGFFFILDQFLQRFTSSHHNIALLLVRFATILVALLLAVPRCRDRSDLITRMGLALAALLLLSPTLYPWYVTWLVPFFCFFPLSSGLAFSGLIGLAYLRYLGWPLTPTLLTLEYVPLGLFLLADILIAWAKKNRPETSSLASGRPEF